MVQLFIALSSVLANVPSTALVCAAITFSLLIVFALPGIQPRISLCQASAHPRSCVSWQLPLIHSLRSVLSMPRASWTHVALLGSEVFHGVELTRSGNQRTHTEGSTARPPAPLSRSTLPPGPHRTAPSPAQFKVFCSCAWSWLLLTPFFPLALCPVSPQ